MSYDELIYTLYKLARETDDEELQGYLLDLGWFVKKNGVYTENEHSDEEIHFADLLDRLKLMSGQAKSMSDRMAINELRYRLSESKEIWINQ
ncbi:hypothetical protein HQ708_06860 [Enterococcus faecium]|nr:hypothetical protein [Enterococcus faecium]